MREGSHHSEETRRRVSLSHLRRTVPAEMFDQLVADPGLKWCPTCQRVLARSEFYASSKTGDGLVGRCKGCMAAYAAMHHREKSADPDWRLAKNARAQAWRKANPTETREKESPLAVAAIMAS